MKDANPPATQPLGSEAAIAPEYDVAIVGFGPVGAFAANLLGQMGINVLVVERHPTVFTLPRAIVLDDEAMRMMRRIGLLDDIAPFTTPVRTVAFVAPDGSRLQGYDVPDEVEKPHGFFPNYFFHQPSVEAVLRQGARRFPSINVRTGEKVVGLSQRPTYARLLIRDATGVLSSIRARYIMACDGARSTIRTSLGIRSRSLGYDQRWLVVDAEVDDDGSPGWVTQICDPSRLVTVMKAERTHWRWEFQLRPDECHDGRVEEGFIKRLLNPWIERANVRLVRAAPYRFHSTFAETWRAGRVFLLGDAAHQMPPFMGPGMCTGLRDAENLCWKIAAVLRNEAPTALLDSYAEERIPHARDMVEWSVEVGRLIDAFAAKIAGDAAPLQALDMRSGYGAGRTMPPLRGALLAQGGDCALIGRRIPSVLTDDDRRLTIDDIAPGAFLLVRRGEDQELVCDHALKSATTITLPKRHWEQLDAMGAAGASALLARPDGVVCAASTPAVCAEWLRRYGAASSSFSGSVSQNWEEEAAKQ